jgi:hypothetical protein
MSSNERGTYPTTRANLMRAYDKLPPVVRRALANAVFNYAAQPFLTDLRRGRSPREIVEEIARCDRLELERERNGRGRRGK